MPVSPATPAVNDVSEVNDVSDGNDRNDGDARSPRRPLFSSADSRVKPARADRSQLPAGDRAALLIGTAAYDHDGYPELPAADAGLRQMKRVLERPDVGMMDTCLVVGDATRVELMRGIETFLDERELNDTVLVYLTGYASVSRRDGRLFFIARDTDPDDLEGTAVSADFVRQCLEECHAASKVVLIDHCAGGPGQSSDVDSVQRRQVMPEPAGVYVIAASETLQPASAMAGPRTSKGTSRFTSEVVEGLRTGRVKSGLGPWVTADDLAGYLAERMSRLGVPEEQRPTTSTLAVSGNHVIARSAVRALSLLDSADQAADRQPSVTSRTEARQSATTDPGWRDVIAYYRACLTEPRAPVALPSREDGSVDYFPIRSGAEVLLSGESATASAPSGVDTFDWKEREVWYGYPTVTLAGGGRRHSASPFAPPSVAPLLVQRVEVTVDARGAAALRPTGSILPHAGVLHACLDDQEAASVLASWRQNWRPGDRKQMLVAVRQLLKRLGLAELAPLDPAVLAADDLETATKTGAHNAACVLYVESTRTPTLPISAELGAVAEAAAHIPGTALEYLGKPVGVRSSEVVPAPLVLPDELDESHEAVLGSALSRPLTVAAAPPGTGQQRLIVDLVSTAVAAGQKVLVASPDDQALDALVHRCGELAPGLLIKTGDAQARAEEKQLLRELVYSADRGTRGRSQETVAAELAAAQGRVDAWRAQLTERVGLEARLRKTSAARAAAAERLGVSADVLDSAWSDDDAALAAWIDRARVLAAARFFGTWQRRHTTLAYLRALTSGDLEPGPLRRMAAEPDAFEALLLFARAEQRMRKDRREVEKISDDVLDARGRELTDAVRALSAELVGSLVAARTAVARPRLETRRMALEPGGRARPASQRELMDDLGGWAVTIDAAQQLALEPGMFDLVVIDEAHRCPVAAVMPLLFRAKRALIVGDPRQRRQVTTLSDHRIRRARDQAGLSAAWLEDRRLTYHAHSVYDAATNNVDEVLLLGEHDGSHPGIARIVDDYFYDSSLTVRTDVKELLRARDPETDQATLLLWEDVNGTPERGPNGGSWRNQAEIDRVVWAVKELRDQLPRDATVGIVTPFRAQVEELRSLFRFEPVPIGGISDIVPGACDAMVLSLVASEDTPAQTVRWVETQVDLWSAALTRARSHVVTVGHHAFWSKRSGLPALLTRLSSVRSFHVRPIPPILPEPVVDADPVADLLYDRLFQAGYRQIERNALVDGYRCDLLVETADGGTAVLLDRGCPSGNDAMWHLRRLLLRRRLLAGLEPETDLAISRVSRVVRVPTWQVRSAQPIAGLID